MVGRLVGKADFSMRTANYAKVEARVRGTNSRGEAGSIASGAKIRFARCRLHLRASIRARPAGAPGADGWLEPRLEPASSIPCHPLAPRKLDRVPSFDPADNHPPHSDIALSVFLSRSSRTHRVLRAVTSIITSLDKYVTSRRCRRPDRDIARAPADETISVCPAKYVWPRYTFGPSCSMFGQWSCVFKS